MNKILFRGFGNNTKSTATLSCRRKLVDYYIYKGFVIIEKNPSDLSDATLHANQRINTENLYKNNSTMA